jgi:hypothetical protein
MRPTSTPASRSYTRRRQREKTSSSSGRFVRGARNAHSRRTECDESAPGEDRADHEQHRSDVHARIFTGRQLGRGSLPPDYAALRSSGGA